MRIPLTHGTPFNSLSALGRAAAIPSLLLAAMLFLTACGDDESGLLSSGSPSSAGTAAAEPTAPALTNSSQSQTRPEPINVVATNAVLADLVGQVGGERVTIHNLVPPGSDLHTWQSTPQDSVRIAEAAVIVSNGAGLAAQVDQLIANAASAGVVQVIASDGLEPQELVELPYPDDQDHDDDDQGHDDQDGDGHGAGDSHFWQNPRLVVHYVNQIATGLITADPDHAGSYLDHAAAYIAELEALDAYISDTLASIPQEHRVIVTFHDAFGYFGARYDMEVLAFVGSHAGDVSPDDIARVLELVSDRGLPAVFVEPQFSADALEQVARDSGIQVGIIRSLPDATHPDYIGMMRANADALAGLLQ